MPNPDTIIAEILAAIALFEHKIESLKQSLAGHPAFDPKTLFTYYSHTLEDLTASQVVHKLSPGFPSSLKQHVHLFINKYGAFGKLSYEEFLQFLCPQNNKSLRESLLLRSSSNRIQSYLLHKFQGLLNMVLVMLAETERMKNSLIYEHDLNLEDVHERVRGYIHSEKGVLEYLRMNQIDIEEDKVKYLRNYVGKKKELGEGEIRNMFTPLTDTREVRRNESSGMRRGSSQGTLTAISQPDTFSKTKVDFLKIKYQPSAIKSLLSTTLEKKITKTETHQNMNNSLSTYSLHPLGDKQNAETMEFQISQSIVKSLTNNFLPTETVPQTPKHSIPLLDLFGKTSKIRYKQHNNYPSYFREDRGNEATYSVLDKFNRTAFDFGVKRERPLLKSRVKFEDDLSFISEQAFRYY